ncbi:MAG: alpha/beta hydrolase, partial [Chromatiaceae bacterium]|nr:alpha/beta hydrolase [Chromatiaceae bacterium]
MPLAVFVALGVLSGCATFGDTERLSRPLALSGGERLAPVQIRLESAHGAPLEATLFRSRLDTSGALVVLAHGFGRAPEQHAGLARALAAHGLSVAVPRLPHARPWSGAHWRNARELIRLAQALEAERLVYVGFSAGALVALIAARNDPRAAGLVMLDAVDSQGLGARLAPGLRVPTLALWGAPSPCNAARRAWPGLARAPHIEMDVFAQASHCAFESPTDWRCRLLCETGASTQPMPRAA